MMILLDVHSKQRFNL